MSIQKLSAQNNGWTKKEAKIFKKLLDFPNITLAGLESAIVVKRHLLVIWYVVLFSQILSLFIPSP